MFGKLDTRMFDRQLNGLLKIDTKEAEKSGAEIILKNALEIVPVKTGNLKNSGEIQETSDGYAVAFMADYAAIVEYGSSRQPAQPYLRPAIDENEKEILDAVAKVVQDEIKDKL